MAKNCKAKANVAKTPIVKAEEKKVEAVKAVVETAKEEVKAEVKAEAVKEVVAEATTAVKETAKKAVKKATKTATKAKKAAVKEEPEVYLQYGENEVKVKEVLAKVKAIYVAEGHRESSIKSLQIYMKPEEYKAYYVINGKVTGSVDLF